MDRLFQKPLQISRSKKSTQNETSSIQLSKESVGNTTVSICKYMENKVYQLQFQFDKDIQVYLDRRIEMLAEKIVSIVDKVEKDQLIKTLQEDSLTKEFTAQRIYEIIVKTLASDQERHLEELALQISLYKSTNEQLIQSLGDTQKDNQSKEQFLEELSNQVQVFKQQNAKQNQENVFNQMAQQCNIIQQLQQQLSDAKQRQINFDISAELEHFKQQITKNQQDLENYENEAQKKNEIIKNLKSEAKNLEKDQQILKSNFEQLLYENEQLKAQILSIESNNEHKIDHIKKKYENLSSKKWNFYCQNSSYRNQVHIKRQPKKQLNVCKNSQK